MQTVRAYCDYWIPYMYVCACVGLRESEGQIIGTIALVHRDNVYRKARLTGSCKCF